MLMGKKIRSGSKYEWMAEREDAAEKIQRIWRGHRLRKRIANGLSLDDDESDESDEEYKHSNDKAGQDGDSMYLQRSITRDGNPFIDAEEEEIELEWQMAEESERELEQKNQNRRTWRKVMQRGKVDHKDIISESEKQGPSDHENEKTRGDTKGRKMTVNKFLSSQSHEVENAVDETSDRIDELEKIRIAKERILKAASEARLAYRYEKKLSNSYKSNIDEKNESESEAIVYDSIQEGDLQNSPPSESSSENNESDVDESEQQIDLPHETVRK